MSVPKWNALLLALMSAKMMSPTKGNYIVKSLSTDSLVSTMVKLVPTLGADNALPWPTRRLVANLEGLPVARLQVFVVPRRMPVLAIRMLSRTTKSSLRISVKSLLFTVSESTWTSIKLPRKCHSARPRNRTSLAEASGLQPPDNTSCLYRAWGTQGICSRARPTILLK